VWRRLRQSSEFRRCCRFASLRYHPKFDAALERFYTAAAGNVPPDVWPELNQFRGFVTGLIAPIQLRLDGLDLILLRKRLSVINVGRHTIAGLGQRDHSVQIQTAFLQLFRSPAPVNRVWVA